MFVISICAMVNMVSFIVIQVIFQYLIIIFEWLKFKFFFIL